MTTNDAPQLGGQHRLITGREPELSGIRRRIPPHVVVLEDHHTMLAMYKLILKRMGCTTTGIQDGDQTLPTLLTTPAKLFLTDYNHPGALFPEMYEQIRAEASLRDLPILLLTAIPRDQAGANLFEHDPLFRFATIPIPIPQIMELITSLIGPLPEQFR